MTAQATASIVAVLHGEIPIGTVNPEATSHAR
jgi:hypothetical protein